MIPAWLTAPIAILLGAVMISGSILYTGSGGRAAVGPSALQPTNNGDNEPDITIQDPGKLVQTDDPMLGNAKAKVTIVEFSDFQCPFCRTFWSNTYSQIKRDYIDTGKVRLVFRDYPLSFHEAARPSALAANCANEQGRFWSYHDAIFAEQAKKGQGTIAYGVTELKEWARQVGMDMSRFIPCLDSAKYLSEVEQDVADGSAVGVSGTPSFFINGKLIVGAQPYSSFKALIDAALQ